jgi:hypothetical protein
MEHFPYTPTLELGGCRVNGTLVPRGIGLIGYRREMSTTAEVPSPGGFPFASSDLHTWNPLEQYDVTGFAQVAARLDTFACDFVA